MIRRPAFTDKLAALGLAVLLVGAAVWGIVLPVQDRFAKFDDQFARDMHLIERLSAGNAAIDRYREAIDLLQQASAGDDRYIRADSPALAMAALQQIVQTAIDKSGGSLRSARNVELSHAGAERPVAVMVVASIRYPDLIALLASLEAQRPIVFVDELNVKSPASARANTEWKPLSVQFRATAYLPPAVE